MATQIATALALTASESSTTVGATWDRRNGPKKALPGGDRDGSQTRRHDYQVRAHGARPAEQVVQHPGRPQDAGAAAPSSRHRAAHRPVGPRAALPDGVDQAGGEPGTLDRNPR